MSYVVRPTRSRSCFVWSTSVVWTPPCVKRFGLSCWAITSLGCQKPKGRRFVISTILALLSNHFAPEPLAPLDFFPPPQVDEQIRVCYQQTMREWLGCEEIVRQREKEQHAAALAKCSSGASMDSSTQKMIHHDSTVSNEVSRKHVGSQ